MVLKQSSAVHSVLSPPQDGTTHIAQQWVLTWAVFTQQRKRTQHNCMILITSYLPHQYKADGVTGWRRPFAHFWKTAQFTSVNRKGSYDRDKLKMALDYLLFNSFIRFGPYVFKQIKGIPMGGNASPLIAGLFLANLEFRYMDKLVSSKSPENLRMAKKLSNNSRYIDDIGVCNVNNNNDFMICSKDIYPESIPLTAGCIENNKDTFFLDLDITIEENRFITKIHHKVDD